MSEPNRNRYRYSIISLLLVVTMVSGCLASSLWFVRMASDYEIKTFDCGNKRKIVISAARTWEISQQISYRVYVDGEIVIPETFIDTNNPDNDPRSLRFTKVTTPDGNLVGIAYADSPSNYLILHDFAHNASFPRGDHIKWDNSLTADENRRRRLRARAELEIKLNTSRQQ